MPTHPPDTEFYEATDTHVLWRDLTRLFEDFCGDDPSKYPEKEERFEVVTKDVLGRLAESKSERGRPGD